MEASNYLSSKQVAGIFTVYSPTTITALAKNGKLPVALWADREPMFSRDPATIRALVSLVKKEGKTK